MLVAGAACGASLAWSHGRLFAAPSAATWMGYNLVHVVLLAPLGVASIVAFEPVTTVAALVAADAPPSELIARAMPLLGLILALAVVFALGFMLLERRSRDRPPVVVA